MNENHEQTQAFEEQRQSYYETLRRAGVAPATASTAAYGIAREQTGQGERTSVEAEAIARAHQQMTNQ